jgi:ribonuclease VapC
MALRRERAAALIVDTSALVAILKDEPDAGLFIRALLVADVVLMSAASFVEVAMVIDGRRDVVASHQLDNLITHARVRIEPFDEAQAVVARQAFRDYGKGSGHPARLNFGDCFSYALAGVTGQPLLFKGDDFGHTDVVSAL